MRFLKPFVLLACMLSVSACSTSPFSCNQTAVDSCLTIEEVNAMTEQGALSDLGESLWDNDEGWARGEAVPRPEPAYTECLVCSRHFKHTR